MTYKKYKKQRAITIRLLSSDAKRVKRQQMRKRQIFSAKVKALLTGNPITIGKFLKRIKIGKINNP